MVRFSQRPVQKISEMLLLLVLISSVSCASNSTPFKYEGENTLTLRGCGIGSEYWGEKIVGGVETSITQYPWQVSLRNQKYGGIHYCGGSLLNTRFVVTAAHCVRDQDVEDISVVLGSTKTHSMNKNARKINAKRLIPHQRYDPTNLNDDIALIELQEEVNEAKKLEQPFIRGVCLPNANEEFEGTTTVTGWGRTDEGGSSSDTLRAVDVDIMTDNMCRTYYGRRKIYDSMLCAGFKEGGKDACQGDSGGPLVKKVGNRYVLVGVVSWGYGCARPNLPGVYTQVSRYTGWIARTVQNPEAPVTPSKPLIWWWGGKRNDTGDESIISETTTILST